MKKKLLISVGLLIIIFLMVASLLIKVVPPQSSDVLHIEKEAQLLLEDNDLIGARSLFARAKELTENPEKLEILTQQIEDLNMKILFSPIIDECSAEYIVKPNDTLGAIAKQFSTTVALVKRSNGLDSDIIHPDQKLKVNKCKVSIAIDKSLNYLFLKQNDKVIKSYLISTGKDNSTPTGRFTVVNKLKDPTWFKTGAVVAPDSPENILGTRWLGLSVQGYGIHGNRDENAIGQQVTQGCIRMRNEEIEQLYDIVPIGTEVVIVD